MSFSSLVPIKIFPASNGKYEKIRSIGEGEKEEVQT